MSELFGKVVSLEDTSSVYANNGCACELEDNSSGVGECYDTD